MLDISANNMIIMLVYLTHPKLYLRPITTLAIYAAVQKKFSKLINSGVIPAAEKHAGLPRGRHAGDDIQCTCCESFVATHKVQEFHTL